MKRITTLDLSLAVAIGFARHRFGATSTTSTTSSAGNLTTAPTTTSATGARKPPTSATAEMVNEAIQRSEARAAKQAGDRTSHNSGAARSRSPTIRR